MAYGRRRSRGLFEGIYKTIMRHNSVYVTFVILGAFAGERLLSVYCGETSSSSQIFLFRFLDRTIQTIKYNVAHMFANFLSYDPLMDPNTRHGDSVRCCSFKELMKKVDDCCQSRTQDWFQNNKGCNNDGDPRAVFNVLDTMLKGSLERLKRMRNAMKTSQFCGKGRLNEFLDPFFLAILNG